MKTFSLSSLKEGLRLVPVLGDDAVAQAIACKIKFITRSRIMNSQKGIIDLLFMNNTSDTKGIFTQMITGLIEDIEGVSVDEINITGTGRSLDIEIFYTWDNVSYELSVGLGSEITNEQRYFS